jgi:methyl-accepting chemotaxis protein
MSNATLSKTIPVKTTGANRGCPARQPSPADGKDVLRSSISVLPIVASQLREVAKHIEESVVKVCGCFQEITQRARQATAQVNQIDDSSADASNTGKVGINHLISEMRETMADLLQRIEHTSTFSGQMVDRLNAMERQIEGLNDTLCDIDEVASKSRLLALNGQLEAARAGEQGAAFAIVATETAKMAVHAVASSKKIRKMIGGISESINGASAELKQRAATDTREASLSRKEVNHSLDAMTALHDDMQNSIELSSRNSEHLTHDISEAVMAMQFQDAVSQRIDHVVQILLEMHKTFEKQLSDEAMVLSPQHSQAGAEDWADLMAKSYTMAAEHEVLASHRSSPGEQKIDLGNNVELF